MGNSLYISDLTEQIGVVDPTTGAVTGIINTGIVNLFDIAFTQNGNLYGTTPDGLYKIDKTTGSSKLILAYNGIGSGGMNGLVGVGSTLYATSAVTSSVYAIDVTSLSITTLNGVTGGYSSGDITYDRGTGNFYETLSNGNLDKVAISGNNISSTVVGNTGDTGLYALATGSNGTTYAADGTQVYSVNLATAALTKLGNYSASTLSSAGGAAVYDTSVVNDFDADSKSDILFQNTNGSIDGWLMNGYTIASSSVVANPGTSWHAIGTGDFNGDGKADILYQNDNGTIDIWQMNGLSIVNSGIVANPGPTWHALGIGDFDGDGKSDILFQNNDGSIDIWTMNGLSITKSGVVANPGTTWHAVGAGDFNGDGKSDILFQNDDGTINIWTMNGLSMTSSGNVANPGTTWHAVGTGDFNGDGKSDILFQNNDGTVDIWTMNGLSMTSSGIVADPGPTWHAVVTGDYNGDGKSDILFQNDDGTIDLWTMNGQSLVNSGVVANPTSSWQAIGQGGIHFINGTQTTGSINGTIQSDDFVFTSFQAGAHVIAGFDPLHDVVTLNQSTFPNFATVQQHETQVSGGTVINLGGGSSLTLANVLPGALTAKNFV